MLLFEKIVQCENYKIWLPLQKFENKKRYPYEELLFLF
jgi:hypothetical protein